MGIMKYKKQIVIGLLIAMTVPTVLGIVANFI